MQTTTTTDSTTTEDKEQHSSLFRDAAESADERLPDRIEVRMGNSERIVVEPTAAKHGSLVGPHIVDILDELGFSFEGTAKHVEDSHANHWFTFDGSNQE